MVVAALIFVTIIIYQILRLFLQVGPTDYLILGAMIIGISTRIKRLAWFWGRGIASPSSKQSQHFVDDVVSFALVPRETPQGTRLLQQSDDSAVIEVKVAIRFWCWFLPSTLGLFSILGIPIGAAIGFSGIWAKPNRWQQSEIWHDTYTTALTLFLVFGIAAIVSYVVTRPTVKIVAKQDTIRVGSYIFDRRYAGGLRPRFSTKEMNFLPSFLQPKMGAVGLGFEYGRWGEDMKYMVNAFHSDAIVIWVNEIIAQVGTEGTNRHNPMIGEKIELL